MLKKTTIILTCLLCINISFGQYKNLERFIPPDFTILDSASGDINKDGIKDLVLILKNNFEKFNYDTTRPLLLLQGNNNRQFKLISRNDNVVLCLGCGGVFGDPYQGITVKKGFFSIEHYGGSGWRWTRIITFKYNSAKKQFYLHKDAGQSWHATDPNEYTKNIFNKTSYGNLPFNKYSNKLN